MPTYDYQCGKCGFEFEREQRITEDPIKTCPKCKSRQAKRLLSAPNFILKGGGWYADGYGSSGAKSGGTSSGSDGADSSSSSGSSDSPGSPGSGSSSSSEASSSSSSSSSSDSSASGKADAGGSKKKSKQSAA